MKKTLSKILTMLLVVTMLFGITATTALAAGDPIGTPRSGEPSVVGGSVSTGWCDLSYDENGVTVVLYPDADAILGINKEQLKEVLDLIIEAAKVLVVEDIKNQILGGAPAPTAEVEEGTTAANIWEKAFGAYITNKYGSAETENYVKFLKDVMTDDTNASVDAFIDYACDLLKSAVAMGVIKLDELPASDKLEEKILKIFNDELNTRINAEIGKYAEQYIAWLEDPVNNKIDSDIEALITAEIQTYLTSKVNAFIDNGFAVVNANDPVDVIIADYMTSEIHDTVDAWLKNYANGNASVNSADINELINDKIAGWIDVIANNYGSSAPVSNPIYDSIKDDIDSLADQKVNEYITSYLDGDTIDASVLAVIEDQLENTCPEIIYDLYWQKKDSGAPFTAGSIWETIHNAIRAEFVEALVNGGVYNQSQAEYYYDNNYSAQLRSDMGPENETVAKSLVEQELSNLQIEEWKSIWNNELEPTDRTLIVSEIKSSTAFITKVREFIRENWTADNAEAQQRRVDALNHFVYSYSGYETELASIIAEAESDAQYKTLISSKVNTYLSDVIATLRDVISTLGTGDLQTFKEKVKAEAENKMSDPAVRNAAFENFFGDGITETKINDKLNNVIIPRLIVDYEAAIEELRTNPPDQTIDIATLLTYLKRVDVGGFSVYNNGVINTAALKSLALSLPRPAEIANMRDDEMQLSYDIAIVTDFGTTAFNVTARLGGGYDAARRAASFAAKVLEECVEFDYSNGTLTLDLKVPAKFSELVLRALNSDKVPETLKKKVFAAMSKNPDDAYALINSVTFEELLSLLDYVDFEELLNSEYLSRFEQLDGLTAEQIKEKAREYEAYYNKLIELVNKVYNNYVPDRIKDNTIIDLYDGEGKFSYNGTHSVNIEKVIEKVVPKYAALITSFLDVQTVTATVDLSIDFAKVNKIEYVLGGATHREGFLPAGADVAYFAGVTAYEGETILGWADASGVPYTEMPDSDVTLYPIFDESETVVIVATATPESVQMVYDGTVKTITVSLEGSVIPAGAVVSYQWYKNTVAVDGATTDTIEVKNVADSGVYYCKVTVTVGTEPPVEEVSNDVNVTIEKANIDFSKYQWSEAEFVYDATEKSVYLVNAENEKLTFGVIYTNNKAINAGKYVASVTIDSANFTESGEVTPLEWEIAKAKYDMSGVTFNDVRVPYDGKAHSMEITGTLPDGVVAEYSENSFTNPGKYKVTVTFTGNENYEEIAPMSATLWILSYVNTHIQYDGNGTLFVEVTSEDGILETYTMYAKDVTTQYNYIISEGNFGDGMAAYILAAYNIFFAEGAVEAPVSGNFTVKLLIPEALRSKANDLKVVHIGDSEEATDMNAVVEGDYFVFTTTHFSVYAIVEVREAPEPYKELDLTWLWILIAVLVVLLIVAVIIIVILKKRKGNEPEAPIGAEEPDNTPEPEEEPVVEEPVVEEPVVEEPVVEEPVVEEPVVEEPVVEEPVVEEPVLEETVVEEPVVEELVVEEPVVEEPVVEEPVVEEPVVEEPVVEEPVVEEPVVEEPKPVAVPVVLDGPVVGVRYRTSFMSRLIQAEEPIQDYYTVIKNALLSYKGVKAKSSWNFESFNKGRIQCAKLNVKGNALQVYLGLDPNEYNANKYHFTDVSDKPKLDKVPMLLKVKSDRALKYALELIEEMMSKFEIAKVETAYVDYHMPYETTEALAARELVKVILPAGVKLDSNSNIVKVDVGELLDNVKANVEADEAEVAEIPAAVEPIVEEPVAQEPEVVAEPVVEEPVVEEPISISVSEVDEIISDEEAKAKIEIVEKTDDVMVSGNKLVEINVDTICENFNDGDVVTLKALKQKRLVHKNAGRVKILARGTMTKKLTIYADKFSLQAVKMITLAGGHADQYKQ